MNESVIEKIRTLNGKFTSGNSCPVTRVTITDTEYKEIVDLVVQECASMARVYCAHEFDFTGDLELDEFMLKHFGVE
jgi:hypothetical protein